MKLASLLLALCLPFCAKAQLIWTRCSNGLPSNQVLSLTHIGSTIYAGTDKGGVFQSTDLGQSWTALPTHNSLSQSQTWSLAAVDTFLFAGQRGGGVLKISEHGSSWTISNSGLTNKVLQDLIAKGDTLLTGTYGGGIFVSYDKATTWSSFHNNAGMDDRKIFSLTRNSTHWFTGTAGVNTYPDTGVAFRFPLNSSSWELINTGFIRNGVHLEGVFSMDANDEVVFAGTDDVGIFRSTDLGANWTMVDNTADVHAIKIVGNDVYYGTSYAGIRVSHDKGITWSTNNSGLVYNGQTLPYLVKDFLVMGNTIYAATDMGVFKQVLDGSAITEPAEELAALVIFAPSKQVIAVSSLKGSAIHNVKLIDLTGKTLYEEKALHDHLEISTSQLSQGIYVVVVNHQNGTLSKKIWVGNH